MSRYWFFPATLPGFLFGSPPPMTDEEFLLLCRRYLSRDDFAEVAGATEYLTEENEPIHIRSGFLGDFVAWERSFRNELSRLRARKAGRDEGKYLRATRPSGDAARSAVSCFAAEDPYQAERLVEQERWNAIERLAAFASFDTDFIIAYRLKLTIAARLERFESRAGLAGYRHLYNDILGRASPTAEMESLGEQA